MVDTESVLAELAELHGNTNRIEHIKYSILLYPPIEDAAGGQIESRCAISKAEPSQFWVQAGTDVARSSGNPRLMSRCFTQHQRKLEKEGISLSWVEDVKLAIAVEVPDQHLNASNVRDIRQWCIFKIMEIRKELYLIASRSK